MSTRNIDFDWKEVDCFLRPQAVVCERIAAHYGLLFLFATSLHRAWGIRRYFVDADKQHFAFVTSAFAELSGLELVVTHPASRDEILASLQENLLAGGVVIVPANLKGLPSFGMYREQDLAHYFIVTGFARLERTFSIWDNLGTSADVGSTHYAAAMLPAGVLEEIARLYWDTYVAAQSPTSHREPRYWLLRIRPGDVFRRRHEREVLGLVLSTYTRSIAEMESAPEAHAPLDDRHLDRLWRAHREGDVEGLTPLIRAHIADANGGGVHLKILLHALRGLGGREEAELAAEIERYRGASTLVRTKLFVRCMTEPHLPPSAWSAGRDELSSLAESVRRSAVARIAELGAVARNGRTDRAENV